MRSRAAIVAIALLAGCTDCRRRAGGGDGAAGPQAGDASGFQHVTVDVGTRQRAYLLYVPAAAKARGPIPLVVALHGGGGKAENADSQTGWRQVAEREGFALAYPNGESKGWNDGRLDTPSVAIREDVDDVGFLVAVIDDVSKRATLDRSRVYMNGISNGAFMTSRFACERPDLVAAIGLVAGTVGPELVAGCKPSKRLSVVAFSGTSDPIVPFEGGSVHIGRAVRGKAVSFSESIRLWTRAAGCGAAPVLSDLPDTDHDDGSSVHLEAFACAGGAAVHAYTIVGGGHTWPGGKQYLPRMLVGHVNRDVDATRVMWSFFTAHPRE